MFEKLVCKCLVLRWVSSDRIKTCLSGPLVILVAATGLHAGPFGLICVSRGLKKKRMHLWMAKDLALL